MLKEKRIKKKQWVSPKLIILTRSKSGEELLLSCKASGFYGPSGPGGIGPCEPIGGCDYQGCMGSCSTIAAS